MNRREVLKSLAAIGIGTTVFHRAVASMVVQNQDITTEMIQQAEWIAGLELTDEQRQQTAARLKRSAAQMDQLRTMDIENSVAPAFVFKTLAKTKPLSGPVPRNIEPLEWTAPAKPETDEDIAFLPVSEQAALIRSRVISSVDLTKLYLARLKKYNKVLNCVVNYTEDLAMEQAKRADREIASGIYRGPLHGIPWGAKDLVAVPGYPTTWGAPQYKEQVLPYKATIAQRLEEAGAVLIAKLTLGALAMGDRWFGGMTRSPWNPAVGSSGSSAGSASSVVAGLAGFTIGTETLGSIISPSRRCGSSGLRPTYGRVSKYGCMQLSWTMDKIGPICRSIQDCALVFGAIHGSDGLDLSANDYPFQWPAQQDLRSYTVGYVKSNRQPFEERADIKVLKKMGVQLKEVELPNDLPVYAILKVLDVEAAAVYTDLTHRNDTEGLNSWPLTFRAAEFVSAVDYVNAMRARSMLMEQMEQVMKGVDVLVNASDLLITNLTGHPSTVMPTSYRERGGFKSPVSTIFTGQLNGESELLTISNAYQQHLTAHLERPPMEEHLKNAEKAAKEEAENDAKEAAK